MRATLRCRTKSACGLSIHRSAYEIIKVVRLVSSVPHAYNTHFEKLKHCFKLVGQYRVCKQISLSEYWFEPWPKEFCIVDFSLFRFRMYCRYSWRKQRMCFSPHLRRWRRLARSINNSCWKNRQTRANVFSIYTGTWSCMSLWMLTLGKCFDFFGYSMNLN